jgi:RNA polymerase primary sigma factor
MEQAGAGDGRVRNPQLRPVSFELHVAETLDTGDEHRFGEALERALTDGVRDGRISADVYEALLTDPGFDPSPFERFQAAVREAGIELPVEEPDAVLEPAVPRREEGGPDRDLLDLYLSEIGRIPLLEHEALLALAFRSRAGDEQARKQIILANLRLVVHIARGYRSRGLPMLDLIEEGNLGLIHAVDRFEPERGHRFSTFASLWIRQTILRGIAEHAKSVRIPVQMFQQMSRFGRAQRVLRGRLGREPVVSEVAVEMDISMPRAERLSALIAGLRSLDEGSGLAAFEQLTLEDLGEVPVSVEHLIELQLEHEKVDRLLRSLSTREEQILRIRYGFQDGVARTLAQTGERFGISRERVRQIEARALEKLRHAIELLEVEGGPRPQIH